MSDLTCPYCEVGRDVPEECHSEDYTYEAECNNCGKAFGFTISYWPSYTELELPCKNGEPHNWKEYINVPGANYVLFECRYCGERENKLRTDILEAQG